MTTKSKIYIYRIYQLIDPRTNKIRYVGRTTQKLPARLKKHLRSNDKTYRTNWITSLKNKNLEPIIELICIAKSHEECCELERFYIKEYRDNGYNLINATDGGEGCFGFKHNLESKMRMSLLAIERMKDSEKIESLRQKGLKHWEDTSDEYKLNNIINQPHRKNISQFTLDGKFIKEYLSLREIERELGYFRANITPCIKGEFKQAYGFIWKYSEIQVNI